MLTVPFDPFSDTLWPFVLAARHALEGATADLDRDDASSSSVLLFGTLTVVFDIVQVTYRRLPYIVCGTVLCVFSLIAYAFRAALAPVKMLITVVVPLAAVFGVAVWHRVMEVFTCTIIIGLALDYDVFLFARVVELRKKGYSNPAAVRGGLTLTGPTITAAGLIMAIAFGGLLLSDVPSNNQIGFVMAFGVLMDSWASFPQAKCPVKQSVNARLTQLAQELWPDRSQLWALILDAPSLSSSRALSADGFGFRPERIVVPNDAELPDTAWPKKGATILKGLSLSRFLKEQRGGRYGPFHCIYLETQLTRRRWRHLETKSQDKVSQV
eukprot:g15191.t1